MTTLSKMAMVLAMAGAVTFGVNASAEEGKAGAADAGKGKGKGEHRNPAEVFQKMDANNDGLVSKDEFGVFHAAVAKERGREAPPKEMLDKRFAALDTNSDGNISKEEFVAGAEKMKGEHAKRHGGAGHGEKKADQEAK